MKFESSLTPGIIKKRYKRFLSDIILESGEEVIAHVPNTGSMTNCWGENWPVLLSQSNNPKRKLKYTLEMTHNGQTWIGVNTFRTNKIVAEALKEKSINGFESYETIKPEQKWNQSRLDFFLSDSNKLDDCFIEVKNVTLNRNQLALFPDSVSTRGQKHLRELIQIKSKGIRAVMIYLIQREDVNSFSPAWSIDPQYSELLTIAKQKGVEIYPLQCSLNKNEIKIERLLPFELRS